MIFSLRINFIQENCAIDFSELGGVLMMTSADVEERPSAQRKTAVGFPQRPGTSRFLSASVKRV